MKFNHGLIIGDIKELLILFYVIIVLRFYKKNVLSK
jgi:hypothetical protein